MNDAIQRDLKQAERHESHLWGLALALLVLFGIVVVGHFSASVLGEAGASGGLTRATAYRALGGLVFLIVLFCLHVAQVLLQGRRMKSLLVDMSGMAASSMETDAFLPPVARKIADAMAVTACQIVTLSSPRSELCVRSIYSRESGTWQSCTGLTFALEELGVWKRAVDALQPVLIDATELARLSAADRNLCSSGLHDVQSVLIVPMVSRNAVLGLIVLGQARGITRKRFTPNRIARTLTLAKYAADAIDESRLKMEAIRDPLTHLYNRRYFTKALQEEMDQADRDRHVMVVLLCDLDRFKSINDKQGHQVGDRVLMAAAKGIQDSTRGTDLVFRWGGDEIVAVLSKSSREGALAAAARIRKAVGRVARATGLDLDVSIGIALYPEHGRDREELVRVADRALYIAKRCGRKVQIGADEYELDERSIKVVFQPVVDSTSRQVHGYEALARDPQGKLNTPALFDKYAAIGRLSEFKQTAFTSQIRMAHELGLTRVFVNADFEVLERLDPQPTPPGTEVVIELSEREALHDLEHHLAVTQRWRKHGYRFAIDDFGAGFISLPFIALLEPDYIKVDRSTMVSAASSLQFKRCLDSVLQGVRTYAGAGIIAEGIEKPSELEMVRDLGVLLAQGFLLGKPQELGSQTREDRPADSETPPVLAPV